MKYGLLNDISGALVLCTVTICFSLLFEPRYSPKRYLASLVPFLAVLFGSNLYVIFRYGFPAYGRVCLLIATIPSCIYFYITSKNRDGRYFFTFCLVDTVSIWFALVSGMFDYWFDAGGLVNFIMRLICSPIAVYVLWRFGRKWYFELLHTVKKGWWLLTAMTGLVYLLLIIISTFPVTLRDRPDDIPLAALISVMLPLSYIAMFYILATQKQLNEIGSVKSIFSVQTASMRERARELGKAEEKLRIMRHDMRHRLRVIEEFALEGKAREALDYIGSTRESLDESSIVHYCSNPVLDAILASYFHRAHEMGIHVESHLHIPQTLPVSDIDLATVFGNALENAITAASVLPERERWLSCTCIVKPTLMFEVRNTFSGEVEFSREGGGRIPCGADEDHGIGSRSIVAFCRKYDASYEYETSGNIFRLTVSM